MSDNEISKPAAVWSEVGSLKKITINLKDVLGGGGFGKVFGGKYEGHKVAVKRVDMTLIPDPLSTRYKSECDIIRTSEHRNVIKYWFHDYDVENVYIVLELCVCSLADYLKRKDFKLDQFKPFVIMYQATAGLAYLHSKGILHRDVKPSNFLLAVQGDRFRIKITDFGISKSIDLGKTSIQATSAGTCGYKACEVLHGGRLRFGSDVFSLGIVYHEILTGGKHPFGQDRMDRDPNIRDRKSPFLNRIKDLSVKGLMSRMIEHVDELRPSADDAKVKITKIFGDMFSVHFTYRMEEDAKLALVAEYLSEPFSNSHNMRNLAEFLQKAEDSQRLQTREDGIANHSDSDDEDDIIYVGTSYEGINKTKLATIKEEVTEISNENSGSLVTQTKKSDADVPESENADEQHPGWPFDWPSRTEVTPERRRSVEAPFTSDRLGHKTPSPQTNIFVRKKSEEHNFTIKQEAVIVTGDADTSITCNHEKGHGQIVVKKEATVPNLPCKEERKQDDYTNIKFPSPVAGKHHFSKRESSQEQRVVGKHTGLPPVVGKQPSFSRRESGNTGMSAMELPKPKDGGFSCQRRTSHEKNINELSTSRVSFEKQKNASEKNSAHGQIPTPVSTRIKYPEKNSTAASTDYSEQQSCKPGNIQVGRTTAAIPRTVGGKFPPHKSKMDKDKKFSTKVPDVLTTKHTSAKREQDQSKARTDHPALTGHGKLASHSKSHENTLKKASEQLSLRGREDPKGLYTTSNLPTHVTKDKSSGEEDVVFPKPPRKRRISHEHTKDKTVKEVVYPHPPLKRRISHEQTAALKSNNGLMNNNTPSGREKKRKIDMGGKRPSLKRENSPDRPASFKPEKRPKHHVHNKFRCASAEKKFGTKIPTKKVGEISYRLANSKKHTTDGKIHGETPPKCPSTPENLRMNKPSMNSPKPRMSSTGTKHPLTPERGRFGKSTAKSPLIRPYKHPEYHMENVPEHKAYMKCEEKTTPWKSEPCKKVNDTQSFEPLLTTCSKIFPPIKKIKLTRQEAESHAKHKVDEEFRKYANKGKWKEVKTEYLQSKDQMKLELLACESAFSRGMPVRCTLFQQLLNTWRPPRPHASVIFEFAESCLQHTSTQIRGLLLYSCAAVLYKLDSCPNKACDGILNCMTLISVTYGQMVSKARAECNKSAIQRLENAREFVITTLTDAYAVVRGLTNIKAAKFSKKKAACCGCLSSAYNDVEDYHSAIKAGRKGITLLTGLPMYNPFKNPSYAFLLKNVARAYCGLGNEEKAKVYASQAKQALLEKERDSGSET